MLDSSLFKKLAEEGPIKLVVSVIIGLLLYRMKGPMRLLKKSPTLEFSINITVYILIPYLACYLLYIIFIKIRDKIEVQYIKNVEQTKEIEENNKRIDEVKSQIDRLKPFEYSVVMYLLKKENKYPYIDYGSKGHGTILDNEMLFDKSECDSTISRAFPTTDGRKIDLYLSGTYQYLLKQNVYNDLKYVLTKTGSISHFKREEIDLNQE
ncbi:hypothetical protein FYJ61_02175 [Lactobacillus equicursoris]|uniref:Uncharacterized protein n=1 Tax=Lactobacillus equicursoris TaxID=420645 RepID=A0A844FLU4_9LACO|nr:hypothetical protein [Lactobacillus equicursoris]MST79309.1 hypothetical protein [Lactobacillus equicursoris]